MILLEIGGFFLLISILLEGLKAAYKNKYSRSFVYTVSIVLFMVIFILTLDFVFSFWNERWLLFPALINSIKQLLTGTAYDYSDLLNFKLSFYGVLGTFCLVYMVFLIKASIVKGKKVIRLDPKKDIPLYMPIKEFSYVYSWLVLTTISVMTIFSSLVFDLSSLDKRLFIGGATLLGIWELLLTIYFFESFKQIKRDILLLELLEKKKRLSDIFEIINMLLIENTVVLTQSDVSRIEQREHILALCISYEVFVTPKLIQTKDETIRISLSRAAKIFFQNQEDILNEGLIVGELNMYNETDTSK